MAYSPISFIAPNYRDYKNWWLKAYEPGTTTPKAMSDNDTGAPTVAKYELNKDGFIASSGETLVIPYIDGDYDLWLFPTEEDADNNDTTNAERLADGITTPLYEREFEEVIGKFTNYIFNNISDTKDGLTSGGETINLELGESVTTLGYSTPNDKGGANYIVVASGVDDGGEFHELDNGLFIQLLNPAVNFEMFGGNTQDALNYVSENPDGRGLITNLDDMTDVLTLRQTVLSNKIYNTNETLNGMCVGNSIMQGTGSSDIFNTIPWLLAGKLQTLTGRDSTSNWAPTNYGVGGSTTPLGVCYVADNLDNSGFYPEYGYTVTDRDYCIVLTLRNDAAIMSVDNSAENIRVLLQGLRYKNITPIFVTDPPLIDMSTGDILDTDTGFGMFKDSAIALCGELGVTVVDAWDYFYQLKTKRYIDLRDYTADGTHPNDDGYEIISELIYQSMINPGDAPVTSGASKTIDRADNVSAYDATAGSVTTTTTISGLTTSSTSRKAQTQEATVEAFVLGNGDNVEFESPGPIQGVVVNLLGGESGYVTAQYGGVSLGGQMSATGTVRETSHYIPIASGSTFLYNKYTNLNLTSTGTTRVLGVSFLCERTIIEREQWLNAVEAGTWSDAALAMGDTGRESSTIGDTCLIEFYGTMYSFYYDRGAVLGKFTYSLDGGPTAEIDCYLNAAPVSKREVLDLDEEGWHTIRIEVTAKNPSSGGNTIRIGGIREFSGSANGAVINTAIKAFEPLQLRGEFNANNELAILNGNPKTYDGLNGNEFEVTGSGGDAALVSIFKRLN